MRAIIRTACALGLVVAVFLPACGGGGSGTAPEDEGPTWVPLIEGALPDTKATFVVASELSGTDVTVLDLEVPGVWLEPRRGDDGRTYARVRIPGLGSHDEPGAPDLPLLRLSLAIPSDADTASVTLVEPEDVLVIEDILVWPQPLPEVDDPTPAAFRLDPAIYDAPTEWPRAAGLTELPVGPRFRSIPAVRFEAWPVSWNPTTRQLRVPTRVRYTVAHAGSLLVADGAITRERDRQADRVFPNWDLVRPRHEVNDESYEGAFLVIYPAGYEDELQPFVLEKKTRGFLVTELTTTATGSTCTSLRTAIQTWASGVPPHIDLYALLVGDTNEVPLCRTADGVPTDDLYASTDGDDLDEEIYLGRLSVNDETDCAQQIEKILAYEYQPDLSCCYREAALWAHKEGAPGQYEGELEWIRAQAYATPPTFHALYGSRVGVRDQDVLDDIDDGIGLVVYRGHGDWISMAADWSLALDYFNAGDVAALAPTGSRAPVVWGIACANADLDRSDCIAEAWMAQPGSGAVSYYGATEDSLTAGNRVLTASLFQAVYDRDLVTQSHAIEFAEDQMGRLEGTENAWRYLLLGDPDMKIHRRNPFKFAVIVPGEVALVEPPFPLVVRVERDDLPVEGALVALHMDVGGTGLLVEDVQEFQVNRYTNAEGEAAFELPFLPEGVLRVGAEDEIGHARIVTTQIAHGAP